MCLGKKVNFFQFLKLKIPQFFKVSVCYHFAFRRNFPEQFELCVYSKYSRACEVLYLEVIKVFQPIHVVSCRAVASNFVAHVHTL